MILLDSVDETKNEKNTIAYITLSALKNSVLMILNSLIDRVFVQMILCKSCSIMLFHLIRHKQSSLFYTAKSALKKTSCLQFPIFLWKKVFVDDGMLKVFDYVK
jgi:hypothetical protein